MQGAKAQNLLNLVSAVKQRVGDDLDFPIPQFVLVGKQSVGKSRLIEALAGELFNFVSGTLGSRRPTILEFRQSSGVRQWSLRDGGAWVPLSVADVQRRVSAAHEMLGETVSAEPVSLRLESPDCVSVNIVDLPGFRDFAMDAAKLRLQEAIDELVTRFMQDPRNVLLCVEEAGDAANYSTLQRCMKLDPQFKRTVLIRNKLDKYIRHLNSQNVNQWIAGYGDLPARLTKIALSLPHFTSPTPPQPFPEMRSAASARDVSDVTALNVSRDLLPLIGFDNFSNFVTGRVEQEFGAAVGPCLQWLQSRLSHLQTQEEHLAKEVDQTDATQLVSSIRQAGASFAKAAGPVMAGNLTVCRSRTTLELELLAFAEHCEANRLDVQLCPTEDFAGHEDYIDYLRHECKVPAFEVELNGGAQYKRLKYECEAYFRFTDIGSDITESEVVNVLGANAQVRVTVEKLVQERGKPPVDRAVKYVAERFKFFFKNQKPVLMEFMETLQGSSEERLFSKLFTTRFPLLRDSDVTRQLVFDKFDEVVEECGRQFVQLFDYSATAIFCKPWNMINKAVKKNCVDDEALDKAAVPTYASTLERLRGERRQRKEVRLHLETLLLQIGGTSRASADPMADRVQQMICLIFTCLRDVLAEQLELVAESFYLLPMLRLMEERMQQIELDDTASARFEARRDALRAEQAGLQKKIQDFAWCLAETQSFSNELKEV